VAIGFLILVLGIGIGVAGTLGIGLIARHVHHGGPAFVGGHHRGGGPRFGPPAQQRPFRPLVPGKPGQPVQPGQPAKPVPSPTG
jgi:hypothetical protein